MLPTVEITCDDPNINISGLTKSKDIRIIYYYISKGCKVYINIFGRYAGHISQYEAPHTPEYLKERYLQLVYAK